MGLIQLIKEKTNYGTRDKLNVAYGWLEEEKEHKEKTYTTSEVFELVKAILSEAL